MSDLSINNRCPDCRIVLTFSGKCPRCKVQVKPKAPHSGYRGHPARLREKSCLGTLHGEKFYKEFDNVFAISAVKISREAMEKWDTIYATTNEA